MGKTLVTHKHEAGPFENGAHGCFARHSEKGMCPGVKVAEWLNSLGDDSAIYTGTITNGQVRDNWLRGSGHIVAVRETLARARAEERRAHANLRAIRRTVRSLERSERLAGAGYDTNEEVRGER